jgi:hypothetical protein
MRDTALSKFELEKMSAGRCPDCDHKGFRVGPKGGASINIECCGCGARYNVTNIGWNIVLGQRISAAKGSA